MTDGHSLFLLALLFYVASAGLYHIPLLVQGAKGARLAQGMALTGFLFHTAAIAVRAVALGHAPYVQLGEAVGTIAWVMVLLTLIEQWRRKTSALGGLAMPLAAILMVLADTLPVFHGAHPMIPTIAHNPLKAHIGAIVTAFGGFALAFCAALLYLVQERRLKEKRIVSTQLGTLSLVEIEQMANALAAFGFSMLTLGLLLGVIWAASGVWHGHWFLQPIVLTTVATWAVYATYLYLRGVRGSRGRSNMYFLIAGFSLAAVTLLIVRILVPGPHKF